VQVTTPDVVLGGVVNANPTELRYHPLFPLGEEGLSETVGVAGPVASKSTENDALAVFPALSCAVQVTPYVPWEVNARI
jgi:hypothetical protein